MLLFRFPPPSGLPVIPFCEDTGVLALFLPILRADGTRSLCFFLHFFNNLLSSFLLLPALRPTYLLRVGKVRVLPEDVQRLSLEVLPCGDLESLRTAGRARGFAFCGAWNVSEPFSRPSGCVVGRVQWTRFLVNVNGRAVLKRVCVRARPHANQ